MDKALGKRGAQERLSTVPVELASAIRAATIDQDVDRLFDLIDGVAEHDAEVAQYLRGLVADVAYDTLEDLFGG
jgi:hypothetical protein